MLNQTRIDKLKLERDRLQKALDNNVDMGAYINIAKGNESVKMVSIETLEKMIRAKEMQIMRAGGDL